MKTRVIIIGLAILIVGVAALWAQRDPDGQQPASAFYGTILYGCECDQNDKVLITNSTTGEWWDYRIARCGGVPGYTTRGQTPEVLVQGWYDLKLICPTGGQCSECPKVSVWHSGMVDQEVNLTAY